MKKDFKIISSAYGPVIYYKGIEIYTGPELKDHVPDNEKPKKIREFRSKAKEILAQIHAGTADENVMKSITMVDQKIFRSLFAANEEEFGHFERIVKPRSKRSDLCGLSYLSRILKDTPGNLISALDETRPDRLYLNVTMEQLQAKLREHHTQYLLRCGISYDSEKGRLFLYLF